MTNNNSVFIQKTSRYFFLMIVLCMTNTAFSSVFIDGFPREKPKQILTDQKNRFFVDYGQKVYVITNKPIYTVAISDPEESYRTGNFDSVVSPDGVIFSLIKSSYTPKNSKTTSYRLSIADCKKEKCKYQLLGSWHSGENASYYTPSKLLTSKKGNLFFLVDYNYKSGDKWITKSTHYFNNRKISKEIYFKNLGLDYSQPHGSVVVPSNGSSKKVLFTRNSFELKYAVPRSSRYKRSIVYDNRNSPHIFFHNPEDRRFYHHFYSPEEKKIKEVIIDQAESGLENVAFVNENAIWSVHYFYRDPFNKGLAVTQHDSKTGAILGEFVIDASETRNSGWELMGAKSSENGVLMTYLSNKDTNKREFVLLNKVEDLKNILGHNFSKYGHPKGKGYLKHIGQNKRAEHISTLNESYSKLRRSGYLNIGAGVQYVFWSVLSLAPDEDSNVQNPYMPKYKLSSSVLNTVTAEGKYASMNFGLSFATKLIGQKVEESDSDNAKQFKKISGKIGWEKLFFNFDFAFQYENTSSEVLFTDESDQVSSRSFDLKYEEFKFSLLTLKRHHFGYLYQRYNFYQPVYIYRVAKGSRSYSFDSQAIGDIDAQNHFFHYGYSTINYLSKYETQASKWFVDGEIRLGFSVADFQGDSIIANGRKPDTEIAFAGAGQLEIGYIWYKRWKILNQFGGLMKISYRIDASIIGTSNKPENLDENASEEKYLAQFGRTEIRHGPLFFVSLVF